MALCWHPLQRNSKQGEVCGTNCVCGESVQYVVELGADQRLSSEHALAHRRDTAIYVKKCCLGAITTRSFSARSDHSFHGTYLLIHDSVGHASVILCSLMEIKDRNDYFNQ
eukprot:scaffold19870_cov80-Skeletonema_marinoi.AAC.1